MGGGDQCAVPLCLSRKGKTTGISFHEFPADPNRRTMWLKNISRQVTNNNVKHWCPSDRSYVCGLHFDNSAYIEGRSRRTLKKFAVPTLFPQFPVHIQARVQTSVSATGKRNLPMELHGVCKVKKVADKFEGALNATTSTEQVVAIDEDTTLIRESKSISDYAHLSRTKLVMPAPLKPLSTLWGKIPSHSKVTTKLRSDSTKISRLRLQLAILRTKNQELKKKVDNCTPNIVDRLKLDVQNGVPRAAILLEQINSYGKKWHRWSEQTIRYCILWRSKSARAYEYVRKSGILRLPSSSTLKSYLGPMNLTLGMNTLIKDRLFHQLGNLATIETYSSLIFDEMAIKPMLTYVKGHGQIFGEVDFGTYRRFLKKKRGVLANRLLCFLMKGISTNFSIPVAYFFVRQLTAEDLVVLTKKILEDLEGIGYRIIRLVGDDCKVNQKTFRILSGGKEAQPEIINPGNITRPLFLCYYCHIMKNLRNNFLNRSLRNNGTRINPELLLKLQKSQENCILKPVRVLNRRMLNPTNFEKMKVNTAVKLFGRDVTSALQLMKGQNAIDLNEVDTTVSFMEIVRKWWELNDVCNTTAHARFKNENREHYWNINDERLKWLESDFIKYFDDWKESINKPTALPKRKRQKLIEKIINDKVLNANQQLKVNKKTKRLEYLTKDTDSALRLTSQSTVLCIRYLIKIGFQFVLSKRFSSDSIEYTFSGIRQMGGRFDEMNAVSSLYALQKILKIGLISSSPNSNVGDGDRVTNIYVGNVVAQPTANDETELETSNFLEMSAKILEDPPDIEEITIEVAASAMVAAFLCKVAKDNFRCPRSTDFLISKSKSSELCDFIRRQDDGGLIYPNDQLICLVVATMKLLDEFLPSIREWKYPAASLKCILIGPIRGSGLITCGCECKHHSARLQELLLTHLVKIFLHNVTIRANEQQDFKYKCQNKPSSRKVLKI